MFSKTLLALALVVGCADETVVPSSPPGTQPAPGPSYGVPTPPPPPRASPIAAENRLPGDTGWKLPVSMGTVAAYTDRASYLPGDTIAVHAAAQRAQAATWELWRLGYYGGKGGRRMLSGGPVPLPAMTPASFDSSTGMVSANWPAAFSITLPRDAVTGVYFIKISSPTDATYAPLVVREAAPIAPILVMMPWNTYQAYNPWGGTSLYQNLRTDWNQWHAYAVSFDRPFAHANGAADFFFCDRDFVTFAEAQGWDMDYAADLDLDSDATLATSRRLVIVEGHAEYFSAGMRAALESAITGGTSLAFLGANDVYWQVRFDPSHRVMTGYKEFASIDPAPSPDLTTTRWRDLDRPENGLMGEMFGDWVWSSGPLVVTDPNAWIWSGTDVQAGSFIAGLYGVESDHRFANGAEPMGLTEIGGGIDENHDGKITRVQTTMYSTPSGATVFAAGTLNWSRALAHDGMWDLRVQQATANLVSRLSANAELGSSALAPMMLPPGQTRPIWRAGTQVSTVATNLTAPVAIAMAPTGDAIVADEHRIVRVSPNGVVSLVAGGPSGFADGPAAQARFYLPNGIAVAPDGTIYVADTGNVRIRAISPLGNVTTLAGSVPGFADGAGASAQFSEPMGIARLSNGTLVVPDAWNARIRAVSPSGQVTTLAGTGTLDVTNGPGLQASLYYPYAVAALPDDSVVFLEPDYGGIRKIAADPQHTVSLLAGGGGVSGWGDGPVDSAQVFESIGVAATPAGDVILLDAATYRVRALHAGNIDTLAGGALAQTRDGSGNAAGFLLPRAATVAPDGSLLVAEAGGHAVRRIRLP